MLTGLKLRGEKRYMGQRERIWERRYAFETVASDTVVVVVAVLSAQLLRFGSTANEMNVALTNRVDFALTYTSVSAALIAGWLLALSWGNTRDAKVFGSGSSEYQRVVRATVYTFGLFAVGSYLTRAELGRGYILIALPLGLFLLLLTRWLWRKRLHNHRVEGDCTYRTLVVGERMKCEHVARTLIAEQSNGYELLGAVTDRGTPRDLLPGVPVVGAFEELIEVVDSLEVDTVVLTSTDAITPERLREIGWELDARSISVSVTAALTDVAGPRVHMRPVSGLPLVQIDYPKLVGRKKLLKRGMDVLGSAVLLLLLSPVLLTVAALVKLTSPGPVLFKHQRIGLDGQPFSMLKFRSMVVGADAQLKALLEAQGTSDKPLHKIDNDPRITPIGRFIRKYSLDELPQLLNVLLGSMSLVGPRPQVESEVALYEKSHHRRLLVRPGITGLWQVSGRSDLSWEDSVRLDLYYVENWSLIGDVLLLFRTVKTVLKPEGAY